MVVHKDVWDLLKSWYTCPLEFPRTVIMRGYNPSIELHPQPVVSRLCDATGQPQQESMLTLLSRTLTVQDVIKQLVDKYGEPTDKLSRLWMKVLPTLCCLVGTAPSVPRGTTDS